MAEIKVSYVEKQFQPEFEQMLLEYLPGSELEVVRKKAERFPQTCLVALQAGKVIGIAFGWPREVALPRKEYCLDGIAVRYEYWGKGVGGQLLEAFEEGMRKYGYQLLSVGSAEGLAEKFYLKHGFVPQSFKVYSDGEIKVRQIFHSLDDYLCYKRSEEGFVVFEKDIRLYEDDFF